jgi:hypothetical protein
MEWWCLGIVVAILAGGGAFTRQRTYRSHRYGDRDSDPTFDKPMAIGAGLGLLLGLYAWGQGLDAGEALGFTVLFVVAGGLLGGLFAMLFLGAGNPHR